MKDVKKQFKYIILGSMILFSIIMLCARLVDSSKKIERSITIDTEPVITMNELGYPKEEYVQSKVSNLVLGSKKVGKSYYLSMSSSDVDGNYDVEIDVYQLNDSSLALQTYKQLIEEKYTYMKSFVCKITSNCTVPTIKYEKAIENMTLVDASIWKAEEVYEYKDWKNIYFIRQENKVVLLELSDDVVLKDELIHNFTECFESIDFDN